MPGYMAIVQGGNTSRKYTCVSCKLLLKEPRQAACGHQYCYSCVQVLVSSEGAKCKSPGCESNIGSLQEVWPDKAVEREVLALSVACSNHGCTWQGTLRNFKDHLLNCDYEQLACIHEGQGCQERVPRKDLASHLQANCQFRIEKCQWCSEEVLFRNLKNHKKSCPSAPARCQWCGAKGLTRVELQKHQDPTKPQCPKAKITYSFAPAGCKEKVEKRFQGDHEKKCVIQHLNMALDLTLQLAANVEQHRERELETSDATRILLPMLEQNIVDLHSKLSEIESRQHAEKRQTALSSSTTATIQNKVEEGMAKVEELKRKILALEARLETFEGVVAVLNQESDKCSSQIDAYARQLKANRELIESLDRKVRSQERIICLKDVALAEQDLRIQSLELASYDGILTWKIPDFTCKRHDAITGKTASFYSPCFSTSRTGYKMCARIYLNGDGMGKGTHISLFFVVMRGHYDGLLRWPFRQKVTFMLLDQYNREHVIDAFRPDPTSSSFQRPTSDMNIASGCPLFVPLSQLESTRHAYVRDDTMFIRVIVDKSDLDG